MISWMQKHRKYLVVTIWISTIAFVGAGFVGWGAYSYGNKSDSVAQVGGIPITMQEFQVAYNNTFQRYNQALEGKLDEATAKKLGLQKQAIQSLIHQALLKNFANEYGIVVSNKEIQDAILSIPTFQKDGKFDKATYVAILQSMGMKPKAFEESIKDEILINKTISLITPNVDKLELEALGSAIFMADRLKYRVFNIDEMRIDVDEKKLKEYWEKNKNSYMTPRRFKLAILWIEPSDKLPDEQSIKDYYKEYRTNFINEDGKIAPLDEVRDNIIKKLQLKATKKSAQLAYIGMKKGKVSADVEKVVDTGDPIFSLDIWEEIEGVVSSTVLKPKIVDNRYAIIKIVEVIPQQPKKYKEAYNEVKEEYVAKKQLELLKKVASDAVNNLKDAQVSEFVTRDSVDKLPPLAKDEATEFLHKLFLTNLPKGTILLSDKAVSYEVLEQKLLDLDNLSDNREFVKKSVKRVKLNLIESNLIAKLQQKYATEIYLKEDE